MAYRRCQFQRSEVTLPSVDVGIEKLQPATINYGNFLQTTFDFIIIALCVFMLIKGINKMARKKKEEEKKGGNGRSYNSDEGRAASD